ncbi:lipid IV(A) 3-deoxy-D-manno-octulosonic acid transferase [Pseudoalteromonas sp. MMG022]|uniref:lipid IV(A) 3-deoxy-D-manno-octulosonic acid transferase n=1 Tax=Pseudoalteromonas sp. MMG022 TaxID=2909978 RepID=UPI001F0126CC|nr:lipid IV(A) 3-deoxy-D-manno-octulosonic acid transferase [Pseudoalteromonas sp. MMG022]MCF6435869.1 lipid IV(A) 3-deoxy-D-manno-octulosonic acid transferase [Pseudoalteromonas sp. MMG022]
MTRLLYSLTLALLSPLILLYLYVVRGKKNTGYKQHFAERLGIYDTQRVVKQPVVFHCASVGEVLAATPLIKRFIQTHPSESVMVTCNTPTGRAQISQSIGHDIAICYLPIDFYFASKRFIKRFQPKLLVVLETELWPNVFTHAKQANCSVCVINARLSEKSFRGYQKFPNISRWIMASIDALASHNEQDAQRFIALGLTEEKVTVTGSIKFDIQPNDADIKAAKQLKAEFSGRPIWVAGSTHPNEHEHVLAAHKQVLQSHPDALLIIAPRHPEQFDKVAALLASSGLTYCRRSQTFDRQSQVLLADTLGELKMLFGCADIAYIGGSLIARGGHNPLEAAAFAVPVLSGPHTYNFAHIYPELLTLKGATTVASQEQLAQRVCALLTDESQRQKQGQLALQCLKQNQGAVEKTLDLLNRQLN